ncbi:PGF-CTERM-anchored ABC transporter substrate-binding protein [Halorubrum sp. AD140]|uniref:PGF-CTERM-anchored ABC transporter substrate-binding protein n=1 Tax=Halorubrum sp. AD140 TaxID=3050073 RepID=UPI002ACC679E|nr:PGF-CTERM-anchored ABC transporter substrate-binding protein [Halorubrum sp. AD140]MDZ5811861.1 PGF-CTERM-anchored ABC transporter substrate-binding protein [Halorubrum sp. AD140]
MRTRYVIAVALLVTTALVGGVAGPAAGAQPNAASPTEPSIAPSTDGPGVNQADDACEFPVEMTDATGTTITLDERPERITTTNPSAAQTLWEIGARDRVVGVTQYAAYLDGADERENVSAEGLGVSVERVVDTEPDLVLAPNASADQVEDLRDQGLTVYHFPEATSIEDIAEDTETTGRLVGSCDGAAETNEEMNDAVDDAEERTADLDRPAALYPLGDGFVAANNTFIDSIMDVGGVDNVAAAEGDGYPQLSNEVILETDPELILVNDPDAAILEEEPYASTTAGVEGNYVVMNVNYLNQPAPRSVIESTDTLASAVEELQTESDGEANESDGEADESDGEADESDGETDESDGESSEDDGGTGGSAPGFGVVAALTAALAAALYARRP